ncbi:type II secretion system F family protein [Psychromonas sp. PT13]|uniref:type II secretion system F family protein n=1 Tax=Psychromonas sp. PT13 TaxID=3439547 RepID=UPI003EB6CAAA
MTQKFKYKALTASGEKITEYIFAEGEKNARELLKKQSLIVLSIHEENTSGLFKGQSRVSVSAIEQSTNQLATLLENGLRINDALEILVDTAASQALSEVWRTIYAEVQSGKSLYQALEKYPEHFDLLYREMANIAENTGTLPSVFRNLANNLAFQQSLKSKTIQALIYPMIIFMVCVVAIFAIFNFVIPNMESVFTSMETLPFYTQWLLDTSHFVSENSFLLIFACVGVSALLYTLWNQEKTRQTLLLWIRGVPFLGGMFDKAEQIRFTSAMSLTLQSGLSLSASLLLSIKTLTSNRNKQQLEQARLKVDSGASLSESLAASHFLDRIALSLIQVGEQSGTLDKSFSEVTSRSKNDFEAWMIKMTALLEPLLILIMGGIVGTVVVIMLLSIVSVNDISL